MTRLAEAIQAVTELLLIRHGESEANAGTSTDPDCSLTDLGCQQARRLGEQLKDLDLSGFVGITSPYRRTAQTAEIIAAGTGLVFTDDDAVREWGVRATINGRDYAHEPIEQAIERLSDFLRQNQGRKLLVVSHAAPIAVLTQLAWCEPPLTEGPFWLGVGNCRPRWIKAMCGMM